jgi:hypothetical protein
MIFSSVGQMPQKPDLALFVCKLHDVPFPVISM